AVARFNAAFDKHDVDGVMAAMTDDCVFENTGPAPDGTRYAGAAAVRQVWDDFFRSNPTARFIAEEQFAGGDRCVVRWVYDWGDGHVRGVDVFRVRDGLVAEKLAYVKG
ncbi:MAG TPA: nuclear transport factor 2 family protein, partial [Chloroflexota bacterium]